MSDDNSLPYWLAGSGRDEFGSWYAEIRVQDIGGRERYELFSLAQLAVDTGPLWSFLGSAGHLLTDQEKHALKTQLQSLSGKADFRVVTRLGWSGYNFVTPYRVYGPQPNHVRAMLGKLVDKRKWKPRGDLESWKRDIRRICVGNPLLLFGVALGFAPPLLHFYRLPPIGIGLVGHPDLGKTTELVLAGSSWGGNPNLRLGFCETMLKTANSLDQVALRYNGALLPLDETKLADQTPRDLARTMGQVVQRLAGGETKERQTDTTLPVHFSLLYLLSSNKTIEEMFDDAGMPFDESYRARLIEIGVVKPYGVFHRRPEGVSAHDFSQDIIASSAQHYGVAIDAYLRKLTWYRYKQPTVLARWLAQWRQWITPQLNNDQNAGAAQRHIPYLSLFFAGACLAAAFGILPFAQQELAQAVIFASRARRNLHPSSRPTPDLIGRVRRYIESAQHKFIDVRRRLPTLDDGAFENAPGFVINTRNEDRMLAFSTGFFHRMFGMSADATLRALSNANLLRHDSRKWTAKHAVRANQPRDRVYCVRQAVLNWGASPALRSNLQGLPRAMPYQGPRRSVQHFKPCAGRAT